MASTRNWIAVAATIFIGLAASVPVSATIIGGGVTAGAGTFEKLTVPFLESDPDNTVGYNNFDTLNLYGFDEAQNIAITDTVYVNVGTNPTPGLTVASHYVFFDPAPLRYQRGYVDFDSDIYGIITSSQLLEDSDYLASTGVTYLGDSLRGLEPNDFAWIDPNDPRRLRVSWYAGFPGDYIRVLTAESQAALPPESQGPGASQISEPAGLSLFGLGLVGLGLMRRRSGREA